MKWNILIAVIIIGAAFGIGFLIANRDDGVEASPTPTESSVVVPTVSVTPTPTSAVRSPVTYTVRLTASGPVPRDLTVHAGDLVVMVSEVAGYWPASDPHPLHTLCPGFDAKRSLGIGDDYSIQFMIPRTCTYHDHLNPGDAARRGSIVVQ